MTKRKIRTSDTIQLGFTFDPPAPARAEADLAGLDRVVSGCVSIILKGEDRSRHEIAGAMSALLDERVSVDMLNAYASEGRSEHNISAARLLALIAVTERFDLLDSLVRRIGGALLVGEEIHTARLGHLKAQRAKLDEEIRLLRHRVQPIAREAM